MSNTRSWISLENFKRQMLWSPSWWFEGQTVAAFTFATSAPMLVGTSWIFLFRMGISSNETQLLYVFQSFSLFSETVYSCFLLGSVDGTRSLWPRLSTLNQSMTQEILHNICLLIPCLAPPISSLITWASFEVTSSGNYFKEMSSFCQGGGRCTGRISLRLGFFMVILYQDEVDGSPLWNNLIKYFVVAMFILLCMYTCLFFLFFL